MGDGGGEESTGWREEGHASGPDVGYVKFKRGKEAYMQHRSIKIHAIFLKGSNF